MFILLNISTSSGKGHTFLTTWAGCPLFDLTVTTRVTHRPARAVTRRIDQVATV